MPQRPRSTVARYGVAALIILAATLLRLVFEPLLEGAGFALFFAAVVVAAWYGGLGPSLLALGLSLMVSGLWFGPPPDAPPEPAMRVLAGLAVFFFVGVATALLSESMRSAQRRAELQAQEALRQREQLHTTLSCIGDGVIVTDARGILTMLNPVAESWTGHSAAEAVGRPLDDVFCIQHEQSGEPMESPMGQALRDGAVVGRTGHTVLVANDGSRRPIEVSAAPIRDAQRTIVGVVLTFHDVTERRLGEQALREADRRKDEFLAILAHELRNPLAPIRSSLDLLRSADVDSAVAAQATDIMDRQVHHLVRLVDDLLDVSRIMRGKITLRLETADLRAVVSAAVETAKVFLDAGGHELTVTLPPDPILLTIDPVRISQVVNNLLTNAAKYTEPGGRIWLSAERAGDEAVVRVRDTGVGISADMLPRVFDLFTQADTSASRSQGGLGIGLTLVRSLVELHGGCVDVSSGGPGQGSEFVVRLPICLPVQTGGEPPAAPASEAVLPAARRRALVVDDNRDAANTLATLLRLQGHEVQVAYDGRAALEAVQNELPDCVFLDIGMPEMDGLEVARRIRSSHGGAAPTLVAVSGWGQEEDRRRTFEAGFDHHLIKPVHPDDVGRLLAAAPLPLAGAS